MKAYEAGGHAYHATLPTDGLRDLRDVMQEARTVGFANLKQAQWAPGVVVSYTADADIQNGKKFIAQGLQIAAGVPLQLGKPEGFRTFRLGLLGHDKRADVDGRLARLKTALDAVI